MALTLSVFDFLPKVDDANDASFFSFAACNCSSAKPSVNRDDRSEFKAFNLPISTWSQLAFCAEMFNMLIHFCRISLFDAFK